MKIKQKTSENIVDLIAQKDARIAELETLVKFYEEQLKLSKIRQFGSSSEKCVLDEQLSIYDKTDCENSGDSEEANVEQITYTRRKRVGKREDDLSNLPVEIVEHKLPENEQICPECAGQLHEMGHDMRRELKVIPAQVKVVEHNRAVYSCRNCEKHNDHVPIVKAPMPEPVIKGSLASPSAVANIMAQKYVMHIPLYRQEKDLLRRGVTLSRQTMTNWVIKCAMDWLKPLYDRMYEELLKREILHADESVLQVLKEPGKTPQSKSYMWLYRTSGDANRHIILFEYQPSRGREHPKRFLTGFSGLLHADGYAVYHNLPGIAIVGCWVHLRRKFTDALKLIPEKDRHASTAQEAIKRIGYLFHQEDSWKDLPAEKRHKLRLEKSKPKAEQFFDWIDKLSVLPKSAMGVAVGYALEQRQWLMNVYLDGRTEFSNNRIENSVRPYAVGRRNWLFCNTVDGAKASATVYSIIETAMANGLKPFEYLQFLFEKLPNSTYSEIESVLPWGTAVPDYCRMPRIKEVGGAQIDKEKRVRLHDGVCSRVS